MKVFMLYVLLNLVFGATAVMVWLKVRQAWLRMLACGLMAAIMVLFMWTVSRPFAVLADFRAAYYPAGRAVLTNPGLLYEIRCPGNPPCGFVNAPIVATLFVPLSLLDVRAAGWLMLGLSVVAVFVCDLLLVHLTGVSGWRRLLVGWLLLTSGPLYYSVRLGNLTHFLIPLLVLAFAWLTERERSAGAVLAVAAVVKPPLLLFGAYLLLRRRWTALTGFAGTLAVVMVVSLVGFGLRLHQTWVSERIRPFIGKPMSADNVQSLDAFLIRLARPGEVGDLNPIEVSREYRILRGALLALLFGATAFVLGRGSLAQAQTASLDLSIVLCLAVVVAPASWTHYYCWLVLPLALYVGRCLPVPETPLWLAAMGTSALLMWLPMRAAWHTDSLAGSYLTELFASRYVLGGLLLLAVMLVARSRLTRLETP